jgi:Asp-tRNA(Asn)/Glu-tRNA(Gln) amidotransferase A subunit family amidase
MAVTDELVLLDATAQAELVRSKQVTPLQLVDAAIARIEKLNPSFQAKGRSAGLYSVLIEAS